MKVKYRIISKLNMLTSTEMDLFFYLVMHQDEKTGFVDGVYYREVMNHTGMCKQSFYNALTGLKKKSVIQIRERKKTDIDYTIQILENAFPDTNSFKEGYVNINKKAFRSKHFQNLTAHEKYLLLEFLRFTHEGRGSMCREIEKFYEKFMEILGVTKRVIRGYLHNLKKFFSIGIRNGKYYITYIHSIFQKETHGKAEENHYLELQVRKECRRNHIAYNHSNIQDIVTLLKQYRPYTSGTEEVLRLTMLCIRTTIRDTEKKYRELNPKYVHKLLRKGLLENSEPA